MGNDNETRRLTVMKFGGSSVGDPEKVRTVGRIIAAQSAGGPTVVVCSAMKGVTDALIAAADVAERGSRQFEATVAEIGRRHHEAVAQLLPEQQRSAVTVEIDAWLCELGELLHGVALIKECSRRTMDLVMSFGERLNNRLIAAYLQTQAVAGEYVDARDIIVTDNAHGNGEVQFAESYARIRARLGACLESGTVPVVTGFIAATQDGVTTTLGRNGSDYTASLIGAALQSAAIEIWTDVDGVLSADPRIVGDAFVIPELRIEEAMELSYFGAEVLHPYTIQPAVETKTPIFIKNTNAPDLPGTRIAADVTAVGTSVTGIAAIDGVALINIQGAGMVGAKGMASQIFAALAAADVNIIMISQASSEHSICIICRETEADAAVAGLRAGLGRQLASRRIQEFELVRDLVIVAVIGANMRGTPGISGTLFGALGEAGINVHAIAQGSSEMNISCVIDGAQKHAALNTVHRAFFGRAT